MSIKNWMLGQLDGAGRLAGRADLPPREPTLAAGTATREATQDATDHLGPYGALVGAVRDELEHFVASHVRLHLAIAERDRFVLTAIGVRCIDGTQAAQARALLEQFMREFRPEQIKRFLAREVIAALPNAAAIDLSQFAGLYDADARRNAAVESEYAELLAALGNVPAAASRTYDVSIVGRWSEADAGARPSSAARTVPSVHATRGATPVTPLAGQRVEFDLEDADGRRRVALHAVLPGRRYSIGKGEACDLRVNGTYTSRRHAELWREGEGWWVGDAGSTNGLRVESAPTGAGSVDAPSIPVEQPLRVREGARIVLSARAEGPAADYPWLTLRATPAQAPAARITPIATLPAGSPIASIAPSGAPRTPLTAILPAEVDTLPWRITVKQAGGTHTLDLHAAALPLSLGRSRNQAVVIHRQHEAVSGHHLDITALDDDGAEVMVHGDNGVLVDGIDHRPGSRLHWRAGQAMVLGAASEQPRCTLTLHRTTD